MDQPFWKNHGFSTFETSCFCSLGSRFFVLEYRKSHIPTLYCKEKKSLKMANFGPKLWTIQRGEPILLVKKDKFYLYLFLVKTRFEILLTNFICFRSK